MPGDPVFRADVEHSRVGDLLEGFIAAPCASVFDGELVSLASRDGRVIQDFGAVCRAALNGGAAAAAHLRLVAFDVLELDGEDLRSRVLERPRRAAARRASHIGSGPPHPDPASVGSPGDRGPGVRGHRSKTTAIRVSTGTSDCLAEGQGPTPHNRHVACTVAGSGRKDLRDLRARRSPGDRLERRHLASRIGEPVELVYSRIDADGSLREVRTHHPPAAGHLVPDAPG